MKINNLLIGLFILLFASCDNDNAIRLQNPLVSISDNKELLVDKETMSLSANDAAKVAKLFMKTDDKSIDTRVFKNRGIYKVFPVKAAGISIVAYVVDFAGGGFNIISATKKYAPILAYSERGHIDEKDLDSNGLGMWIDIISRDIENKKAILTEDSVSYLESRKLWNPFEKKPAVSVLANNYPKGISYWFNQIRYKLMDGSGWSTDVHEFCAAMVPYGIIYGESLENTCRELNRQLEHNFAGEYVPPAFIWGNMDRPANTITYGPLLKTYWNQDAPYNNQIEPKDSDPASRKLAGCVTVATSQILNYHKYPSSIDNVLIDWNKTQFEEILPNSTNTEIPKLIKVVNVGVKTVNGDNGSSAYDTDAVNFLQRNGYMAGIFKSNLATCIINEIANVHHPVYISGAKKGEDAGHAWVCYGYRSVTCSEGILAYQIQYTENKNYEASPYVVHTDNTRTKLLSQYFHMNWGWGNRFNQNSGESYSGTGGWFRSVFGTPYIENLRIIMATPKK